MGEVRAALPDRTAPGADLFDDDYHRLIAPFHPETETRREVAAIRELLGLAQDDVILDLGCGWGRHLDLLAGAGHRVVGLDLSPALLRQVPPAHDDDPQPRVLVAGDMRRLPFPDASFDAVVNLATSLGLFLDDQAALQALDEARRVLMKGGKLLIEGMNRDDVVAHYAPRDAWTLDDGTEVRVRRRFDAARGVSHEVMRWRGPAGGGTKRHSLRLRSLDDLVGLLNDARLAVEASYGTWEGGEAGPGSEQLIVLARR